MSPLTWTSPSSASRISTPGSGGPTVPSLTFSGGLTVAAPHVSDMPQSSPTGIPIAWKNSRTSIGVGAAPTLTETASSRPRCLRRPANIASSAIGGALGDGLGNLLPALLALGPWRSPPARPCSAGPRCSSGRLAIIVSRPALSFSQTRGTAKNQVGRTVGRKSMIVRGSGQIATSMPFVIGR